MADEGGSAAAAPAMESMLDCVQITPEHIRANGTLHSTPFEGIAELIDNAVDSQAHNVYIENRLSDRPNVGIEQSRYVVVMDDGAGMDRKEALKTILVGHSLKRGDVGMIGQFGNGLKSGSIRIGETMLLATKRDSMYTVLMISLKYLDTLSDHKCYVPCISYTEHPVNRMMRPLKNAEESQEKHKVALDLILQYSPFHTEHALQTFLKENLVGASGTVVAVSDLKRLENGCWEMSYDCDFILEKPQSDGECPLLSSWLQQLYIDSKIVMHIGGRQVRVQDPRLSLAAPRWVPLSREKMGQFVKREEENVEKELKKLEAVMVPVSLRVQELQNKNACAVTPTSKELRTELRMKQHELEEIRTQIENISKRTDGKNRPGADIRVYLGIDVEHRNQPRIVFYSSGRRICTKPLEWKNRDGFHSMMGVVAIVDIPSTLLPTTQNRERFEIPSEFDFIVKKIVKHAKTYFEHIDGKYKTDEYWRKLGYLEEDALETDEGFIGADGKLAKLALQELPHIFRQCGRCREFRSVKYEDHLIKSIEDDNFWQCEKKIYERGETTCAPKSRIEKIHEAISELSTAGQATKYEGKRERERAAAGAVKYRKPLAKVQPGKRAAGRSRASSFISDSRSRSPMAARKRKTRNASAADSSASPPPRTRRRSTTNNPRSAMSSRTTSPARSSRRQKKKTRGRYAISSDSSGRDEEWDETRSQRVRSESTDSEDRRLASHRRGRATRTAARRYDDGEEEYVNDAGRDGPLYYDEHDTDLRQVKMEGGGDTTGHEEIPLFRDLPATVKREEEEPTMENNFNNLPARSRAVRLGYSIGGSAAPAARPTGSSSASRTAPAAAAAAGSAAEKKRRMDDAEREDEPTMENKFNDLPARSRAAASATRTSPPAATAAANAAAEKKRRMDGDEGLGDVNAKKKRDLEDMKREETDDQLQHRDNSNGSSPLVGAAGVAGAAGAAAAAVDLDDTIARIYAGDLPAPYNADSATGTDMNESALDGAPRSHVSTREQRGVQLGQRCKTYAELLEVTLNLQEQFHEKKLQLEGALEREQAMQQDDTKSELVRERRKLRNVKRDLKELSLLSNSDAQFVLHEVAHADDAMLALTAEMGEIRRQRRVGAIAPTSYDHEEEVVDLD